jgi:CO dehydrogenase nickel-insertion accessory protein CooC1
MIFREGAAMAKIIVSTGRGGTGKTTFVAVAARYLESPFLLIDLDPDQNLADMLGIDLDNESIITSNINELFVFLDPSIKSIKHIKRVKDISEGVGIHYDHLYIVGNYEFDQTMEDYLHKVGQNYVGKVEYDKELRGYNLTGKSLFELADDSPACLSVREIIA